MCKLKSSSAQKKYFMVFNLPAKGKRKNDK